MTYVAGPVRRTLRETPDHVRHGRMFASIIFFAGAAAKHSNGKFWHNPPYWFEKEQYGGGVVQKISMIPPYVATIITEAEVQRKKYREADAISFNRVNLK